MTILPPAFQDAVHEPFYFAGGPHTAILVHGFPGTPAEMRGIGRALHAQGWSVHGILLPGLGAELYRLGETRYHQWLIAIRRALVVARHNEESRGGAVLLVGLSMGAALSLHAARLLPVEGLVLLAPFWRMENRLLDRLFGLLWPYFPTIRPFRYADVDDAQMRRSITRMMPDIDLDDVAMRQALRQLSLPTDTLNNVRMAGRLGYQLAAVSAAPALVIQGSDDRVARPALTQQWASQLPNLHSYVELPGDHAITDTAGAAWPCVEQLVVQFAQNVIEKRKGE